MDRFESLSVLGPALPPAWLRYRDAYVVLQHLCTLSGGAARSGVAWPKVVAELGFSDSQGEELLRYLVAVECVEYREGRREVGLTGKALEYLDSLCGRRRSVRPALALG